MCVRVHVCVCVRGVCVCVCVCVCMCVCVYVWVPRGISVQQLTFCCVQKRTSGGNSECKCRHASPSKMS
jgi:hypothetical protein